MRPRAILFDLDDTLISAYGRPREAWREVARSFADELGSLTPDVVADAVQDFAVDFWSDAERHRYWRHRIDEARRQVVAGAFARLAAQGLAVPGADVGHRLAGRFTAYRDERMALYPDAHDVVDRFRGLGVRLAVVTNGPGPAQRAKLERFALTHRFDHVQIEGEHGFGKPEERAYRHALAALGAAPEHTWMVGDNLEWEVAAPQRLGIHAVWIDSENKGLPEGSTVVPDRTIKALSELLTDS
jgi:putative hydrolase of the HAD superfamily